MCFENWPIPKISRTENGLSKTSRGRSWIIWGGIFHFCQFCLGVAVNLFGVQKSSETKHDRFYLDQQITGRIKFGLKKNIVFTKSTIQRPSLIFFFLAFYCFKTLRFCLFCCRCVLLLLWFLLLQNNEKKLLFTAYFKLIVVNFTFPNEFFWW